MSDEFSSSKLGLQWQWHANHRDDWFSLSARDGFFRLFAQPVLQNDLSVAPNLLLQKFPAREFTVETSLELVSQHDGVEAGLVVMGNKHAALALRSVGKGTRVIFRCDGREQLLGEHFNGKAKLCVKVEDGGLCSFTLTRDDGVQFVVREKFQAQPGKWIGAKVGLYCISGNGGAGGGFADFDYFRFAR